MNDRKANHPAPPINPPAGPTPAPVQSSPLTCMVSGCFRTATHGSMCEIHDAGYAEANGLPRRRPVSDPDAPGRPRCKTCGQFLAFRPLEAGPDVWQARAIERIRRERLRQDAKWGVQNHAPDRWSLILTEETGEVAKAALEGDHAGYIAELVQVAAVALSALECAARGEARNAVLDAAREGAGR